MLPSVSPLTLIRGEFFLSKKFVTVRNSRIAPDGYYPLRFQFCPPKVSQNWESWVCRRITPRVPRDIQFCNHLRWTRLVCVRTFLTDFAHRRWCKIECPEIVEGLSLEYSRDAQFCKCLRQTKLAHLPNTNLRDYNKNNKAWQLFYVLLYWSCELRIPIIFNKQLPNKTSSRGFCFFFLNKNNYLRWKFRINFLVKYFFEIIFRK
jgi:hypothetical protein